MNIYLTRISLPTSMLILWLIPILGAIAQQDRFRMEDINRMVNISNLEISPDGSRALFMTSRRNLENNNYDRALVVLNLTTKEQQVVGTDLSDISSPAWLNKDDVALIAYTITGRQVQVLNLKTGETKVITKSATGVMRFAYSPDEKWLAYLAKEEKPTVTNSYNDVFEVGDNDMFFTRAPMPSHLYVTEEVGTAQRVNKEGTTSTGLSTSSLSWSGDSKILAFTQYTTPHSGSSDFSKNFLYSPATKELKPATGNKDNESTPRIAPGNQQVWFTYPRNGVAANISDWHRVELKGGVITNMTETFDRQVYDITWLEDGSMLLSGPDQSSSGLWHVKQGKFTKVNVGPLLRISDVSVTKKGNMVLSGMTADRAIEIYHKPTLVSDPILLTGFNNFVHELKLGRQEMFSWTSKDGLEPNGVITFPPDFFPEKKYPLVLYIHGGPTASSLLGFSNLPQALAAKGWIVFEPNYRGSNNLGNAFQSAIAKDPSEGPGHDVITGVNALKSRAYVDNNQVVVSGWSYGGWMSSWLIGRYPEVWKAAVVGAAPVDFTDMYSLNDLNRMRRHAIVESPYASESNLEWAYKNSPIWHFSKIKAPTLIMSKTADSRVTVTGSYKLFGALRDNGVETKFIAYPGPDHFPADPVRSMDVYERWIGWIESHLNEWNKIGIDK
ncbi:MAG TPA: S9 family peptidase [Cyclobacteriaceae bacterium]